MIVKQKILAIITAIMFFFCAYSISFADILINEIYPFPDPNGTETTEWIELVNTDYPTDIPIIANWTIWDTTSTSSLLYTFTSNDLFINQFFVIEINSKLNNTGDGIIIRDSLGNIIDQFHYSSSQIGMSWSRTSSLESSFATTTPSKNQMNIALITPTSTPNPTAVPTIAPTPPPTSAANQGFGPPFLSEIMACPESGNEWIEIQNPNSATYYLQNWSLHDAQGKLFTFSDQIISANSFLTIEINQKLSNSGDQVTLKNENQEIISNLTYSSCAKGYSWIWQNNNWAETETITKNAQNPNLVILNTNEPDNGEILSTDETQKNTSITNNAHIVPSPNPLINGANSTSKLLKFPNTKTTTFIEQENAKYITSPIFYDHLFFINNPRKLSHIISVIMGGLLYLLAGIIIIRDVSSNDFKQDY